jgi:hypothetical protein
MLRTLLALAIVAASTGCGQDIATTDAPGENLVGTWQHRAQVEGGKVHLVVSVLQDGKFVESFRFTAPDGKVEAHEYTGEWSFDGSNFKRRYLSDNGRILSGGSMRYATLEVASFTPRQFVGKDNVRHREFTYERVSEGTKPWRQ